MEKKEMEACSNRTRKNDGNKNNEPLKEEFNNA
jgi:hypothetical protein